MRILNYLIIILSFFMLLGCGGGGGVNANSYKQTLKYEGKTSKASLDNVNIQEYLNLINPTFGVNLDTANAKKFKKQGKITANKKETQVDYGSNSGKVETTIEYENDNGYSIIQEYSNYSNQKGIVLNGIVAIEASIDGLGDVINVTLSYQMFEISINGEKFIFDGNSYIKQNNENKETRYNLVVKHVNSSQMIQYRNFKVKEYFSEIVSYNGRIYISDYGYVDIVTKNNFSYNVNNEIEPGSTFYIKGKNQAIVKFAYDGRLRLELDGKVFILKNGKEVKNEAPVIKSVTFPKKIYTNTDINPQINVIDPDLDEIKLEYKWYINNSFISNKKNISNTLFKRGDKLKLIVTAKDNSHEVNKTKEQSVLNTPPEIVFSLDKNSLKIGEKLILDASQSFDADGDKISFRWEMKPKYEDKVDNANLEENLTKSKITLNARKVNYNPLFNLHPYTLILEVTDEAGGVSTVKKEITIYPKDFVKDSKVLKIDKSLIIKQIKFIDLDGDNQKELVVLVENSNSSDYKVNIYSINNNQLDLIKEIPLSIDCYGEGILKAGDFNSDDKKDLIAQCVYDNSNKLTVLYQNDNFEFSSTNYLLKSEDSELLDIYNIIPADINKDSKEDITVVAYSVDSGTNVMIFTQNENGILSLDKNLTIYDADYSYNLKDSKILDIDNDKKRDIFIYPNVFHQENNGSFSLNNLENVKEASNLGWSAFADINSDGSKNLLVSIDNKLHIYKQLSFNNYEQLNEKAIDVTLYNEKIYMQDINHDQKIDVLYPECDYNKFCIIENRENWDYNIEAYDKINYGNFAQAIDLNGDGKKELVFYYNNKVQIISFK